MNPFNTALNRYPIIIIVTKTTSVTSALHLQYRAIEDELSPLGALSCVLCFPKSLFINLLVPGVILKVVDHYENPRNVGSLDKNAKNVGTGLVGAPACGDVMKLQVCWT